jgi:predicted TIM-barrel fold metal-dependent hydrolase
MGCTLTADQILEDFKTFYYETALSAYEPTLLALEAFVHPSRILFGTDFPGQPVSQVCTLLLLTLTFNIHSC